MQPQAPPQRELTTWPEIAAYLGVTERTAQMWRKERGLPVRRIGGRVIASVEDLEQWKSASNQPTPQHRPVRLLAAACALAALVIALAGWIISSAIGQRGRLARYELQGKHLVVFDEFGHRAWSHSFPHSLTEAVPPYAPSQFADIDDDGWPELLFIPWDSGNLKSVYCFRSDGSVAWNQVAGRTITDVRGQTVLPSYWAMDVAVLKHPRPDGGRVVILAHHSASWPSQIVVLTPEGKLAAEYWHPGWLMDLKIADLNGDGREELLLGGINNSLEEHGDGAVLLVLDSHFRTGQGPTADGDPRWVRDIPAGEQLAVLTFPHIPKSPARNITLISDLRWNNDYLEVRSTDEPFGFAHYQLDRHLRVVNITPSAALLQVLAPRASVDERRKLTWELFGGVKVLKNSFDRKGTE